MDEVDGTLISNHKGDKKDHSLEFYIEFLVDKIRAQSHGGALTSEALCDAARWNSQPGSDEAVHVEHPEHGMKSSRSTFTDLV
jgi:hypothetical protein